MYPIQKECSFADIFMQKALPQVCCRLDFDGKKWWMGWSKPEPNGGNVATGDIYAEEMDRFQKEFMAKPEMKNLDTMKEYCKKEAETTSDPTEFNLYSETERYNVWIRLITRSNDYNAYIKFYPKASENH